MKINKIVKVGALAVSLTALSATGALADDTCALFTNTTLVYDGAATSTGVPSLACGSNASADGTNSTAIGVGAISDGAGSTSVGTGATTTTFVNATAIGYDAHAEGTSAVAFGQGATANFTNATAVGQSADALSTGSSAFGQGAQAGAVGLTNATAVGYGAQATGQSSTAVGQDAQATFANSAAFGAGVHTTAANQMSFGTTQNTYTMSGITSAASRAAQTGPLQIATTDANGNLASDGGVVFDQLSEHGAGIAIAMAMANPDLTGNEKFGLAANVGFYEGNTALAVTAMGVLGRNMMGYGDRWALAGGVGFSVGEDNYGDRSSNSTVGGRAGLQVSW